MKCTIQWTALVLAAGLANPLAAQPLKNALVHGVFQTSEALYQGVIHPLEPAQELRGLRAPSTFWVAGGAAGEGMAFPVLAAPGSADPADLSDIGDAGETFLAPVDLTGAGVSDLIYVQKGMPGWKVMSNGQRLDQPATGFVAGFYEKGSADRRCDYFPADTRDLIVDQDFLAVVGDFLGNGTEQLAYTRPGQNRFWVVGAHGVTTMNADLKGLECTASGPRCHWLFPYKAARTTQRTRIAYYRAGSDHLIRLVPKGMEFVQERVPLKGHWERLNQAVLDWPRAAIPESKVEEP